VVNIAFENKKNMASITNKKVLQELINNIGVEVGEISDKIDDINRDSNSSHIVPIIERVDIIKIKVDFMLSLLNNL
jgi:hypothetical protein